MDPDVSEQSLFGGAERLDRLRQAAHILVIDDEELNRRVIGAMLARAGYTSVAMLADARGLERQMRAQSPDLIVLDLHMPGRDGFDVLQALQPWIASEHLPVLVVTSDTTRDARHRALKLGARDFVTKPFDLTELTLRVRNQLETRLLYHDVRKQNRALHAAVHGRTRQLEDARVETLERLAVAAEYRDEHTSRHTARVGELSGRLAQVLGLAVDEVDLMKRAAVLHDVGKIGIPDALLLKPSRLTEEEMAIMRTHTIIGARILEGSAAPMLQMAEVIARSHHEQWDGSGYPFRLKGDTIPLGGRIVSVADSFDALTSDRPYRQAFSTNEALAEIGAGRGTQYDASIVDALLSVISTDPGGRR